VAKQSTPEKALSNLQRLVRQRPKNEPSVQTRRLPEDLTSGEHVMFSLNATEEEAFQQTQQILLDDLRFEHLGKAVDAAVWRFLALAYTDRTHDHVRPFLQEHGRELTEQTCYIPIDHLSVSSDVALPGLRLLPPAAEEVPRARARGFFTLDPPVGSVAAVPVTGTDHQRMAERAALVAEHTLRTLRVALREHLSIHDRQLRFRLTRMYVFGDGSSGWQERAEAAYDLALNGGLLALATGQAVSGLPVEPRNALQRKADVALRWMERASFAAEPITALLFLFFALEALLGDTSEGLKAPVLAFRRAVLSHAVTEGFSDPGRTYWLYATVRSKAVHGESVRDVGWDEVSRFGWDVREALNEYLEYARQRRFTKQSQLIRGLDQHPDRPRLVDWLTTYGGSEWRTYLGESTLRRLLRRVGTMPSRLTARALRRNGRVRSENPQPGSRPDR
jgi:hypothetical protein